jgi:hypothetical protein
MTETQRLLRDIDEAFADAKEKTAIKRLVRAAMAAPITGAGQRRLAATLRETLNL